MHKRSKPLFNRTSSSRGCPSESRVNLFCIDEKAAACLAFRFATGAILKGAILTFGCHEIEAILQAYLSFTAASKLLHLIW
jgi:hypothetical protein